MTNASSSQQKACQQCGKTSTQPRFLCSSSVCAMCGRRDKHKAWAQQRETREIPENVLEGTKQCAKCKQEQPKKNFTRNNKADDFLLARCRQCIHKEYEEQQKKKKHQTGNTKKTCVVCKQTKDVAAFHRNPRCKTCVSAWLAERREKRRKKAALAADVRTGTKVCTTCKETKPKADFCFNFGAKDSLTRQCKPCAHHAEKEKRKQRLFRKFERGGFCVVCKTTEIAALDWAHRDRKAKIAVVGKLHNKKKLDEEIAKCDLKCKNCHEVETAIEDFTGNPKSKTAQRNFDYINKRKVEIGKCAICEWKVPPDNRFSLAAFRFDHLDPALKYRKVSAMLHNTLAKVEAEIQKCRLICSNCDAAHTNQQFGRMDYIEEVREMWKKSVREKGFPA